MNNMNSQDMFKQFKFKFQFRKHQEMVLKRFEHIADESRNKPFKYHVVSPPGSGKTIMGIEMGIRLGKPLLVICPNTAIQGQWADKIDMFVSDENVKLKELVNTDSDNMSLINIFTYQMLSVAVNDDEAFIRISENLWAETISCAQGIAHEEALIRINTMKKANPPAYRSEISKFNKRIRKDFLNTPDYNISKVLHPNTIDLIRRLKENETGTVIFDECHHLQNYWALIMREIVQELKAPNIIGLTATPPIDADRERLECYTALLGDIDYHIPTPAVVKEGLLSPYQDLVYFCTPTEKEFEYLENCHLEFKRITELFNNREGDFYYWIFDRIVKRKLVSGETQDWTRFINSRPGFASAGVKYLLKNECKLPWNITITEDMYEQLSINDWVTLIEDYALNLLKLSRKEEDKELYDNIRDALRNLGYILTEKGVRSYSSPIDRLLAYSKSKIEAIKEILKVEMEELKDKIRVAVITDFEVSNALSLKKTNGLMDEECGGAIAVMKELVTDNSTDMLDPVMITAKSLICDDDLAENFIKCSLKWAEQNNVDIKLDLSVCESEGFVSITGSGKDWNSKTAVLMTTYLFENGITRCIVGTRGLLSEGWDSLNLNTLIDLTAVTTFASVNQLKGRSLRKSRVDPQKVSNNWDIICIAPGLEKGYNDLVRLYRKHDQYYGVCDDGQIQKGINHLDPSLGISKEYIDIEEMKKINSNMMETVRDRDRTYKLWRVGEPFDNVELGCCEIKISKSIRMKAGSVFVDERKVLGNKIRSCAGKFVFSLISAAGASAAAVLFLPAVIPAFGAAIFMSYKTYQGVADLWKYGSDNFFQLAVRTAVLDISRCLLNAMVECEMVKKIDEDRIVITERSDGTIRVYLDGYDKDSEMFSVSLGQIFSPVEDQRYAIQRFEVPVSDGARGRITHIIKYGLNKCEPVLSFYHPLPDVFNIKEKALVFKKYWNKYVSPGDVVFLKGESGKEVVERYGRTNFLSARKRYIKVWK